MSTAEQTEKYIERNKAIKDCLKMGLINYSSLSRKISTELKLEKKTSKDAVLVASIRYAKKIGHEKIKEDQIKNILREGTLEIKNRVSVFILEKSILLDSLIDLERKARKNDDVYFSVEGTKSITLMVSQKYDAEVRSSFRGKIISYTGSNAVVIIKSPRKIETESGVLAYIAGLFADNDVNIVQSLSCWTDTIFIVRESDVAKIMEFMKF